VKKSTLKDKWMRSFQSKVFWFENTKFNVQSKLFPNAYNLAEKRRQKYLEKKIEKVNTEEEKRKLIENYKQYTLELRKEKHRKENINYHLDMDNPHKTLFWLNNNKAIHKRGLKKNIIKIPILIALLVASPLLDGISTVISTLSIIGLSLEAISTFINANCILLQNYNIERVNKYIEGPYQKRRKRLEQKAKEYNEVTSVVSKTLKEQEEIPEIDDILNNIQTSKQAKQLLELIQKEMNYRDININKKPKVKVASL